MNADQILAASKETYATCPSYRDKGEVVSRFIPDQQRPHTEVRPFSTAFVRPDRLRFEFRKRRGDLDDRYIVWYNGQAVRTWWDAKPGIEELDSLGLALVGASGISCGSSDTIPSLLLSDVVGPGWVADLTEVERLGEERLGNLMCYRLRGKYVSTHMTPEEREQHREEIIQSTGIQHERGEESPYTVWIDQATLLIRRIERGVRFETFQVEERTEYEPEVGGLITDDELGFVTPE